MRRAGQNPTDVEVVATIKKNFLNILKGNNFKGQKLSNKLRFMIWGIAATTLKDKKLSNFV